jgi:hypothetical protein
MMAVGCLLGLWQAINLRRGSVLFALILFGAALVATLSRGPWMGTAALIVAYIGTSPNSFSNLSKLAFVLFMAVPPCC